jgi:predicted CoA-binding protein
MSNSSPLYSSILKNAKTIAVVGLSDKSDRSSYGVTEYMQKYFEIIPINPMLKEWNGLKSYSSLLEIPKEKKVDIVNVFRKAEDCPAVTRDAVTIGANSIWLQQGIISEESEDIARHAHIPFVMDACIAVLHSQLLRNL